MEEKALNELAQRHEMLLNSRRQWDTAWKSLATHFLPTRYRDVGSEPDAGKKPMLNDKLVDSTGILAMRTLAAGLQGGMTSPARPWFRLSMEDEGLSKAHGVREYLDEVASRMRNIFHRSNFYNAIHTIYSELGTFGTAYMMEIADYSSGFRFVPFCAGEYCLDVDEKNRVDTVFRRFQMTSRQLMRQFEESKLPEMVKASANKPYVRGGAVDQWTVVHAIYPRKDTFGGKLDATKKPWASVYWLDYGAGNSGNGGKPTLLSESGFDEFPGFGPRWATVGNDVYGRSPAMDVLPDCRMLQQVGTTTIKAIHKALDPPMSVSAGLKSVGLDLTPGGLNYVATDTPGQAPQAATPIMQIRPEIQGGIMLQEKVQRQIQAGLYNDLFKMLLDSSRSQITAREVAAKEEEKLILIGPVLERLHDELFIPLVDRTFNLMARMDMLPAPPPELAGMDIKVEFVSLLAQAQKMVSTSGVDQLMAFVGTAARAYPEALDAVDIDNVVDGYAEYLGVQVDMVRPKDDRDKMRQERAQAQAMAQQQAQAQMSMQGMQGMAETARTLSEVPSEATGGTALDALVSGIGGL